MFVAEEFVKKNDPDGEERLKFDFPSRELGFYGVPFKVANFVFLLSLSEENVFFCSRMCCCSPRRKTVSFIWWKDRPFSSWLSVRKKDNLMIRALLLISFLSGCGSGVV